MRSFAASVSVACFIMLCSTRKAHARDETALPSPQSPKRALPDYDGLEVRDTKPDDAGVWLARILLSPLWFTTEFLIRLPAHALMTAFDGCDCTTKVSRVFAWPHYKLGFLPVGYVDVGLYPGLGLYAFWNDALVPRNDIRLHYETWPTEWFGGTITDRYRFDGDRWLQLRVSAERRPDQVFYGLGPSSLQSQQSRYGIARFDVSGAFDARTWRSSEVRGTFGLRKVDIFPGHYGDDPSVEQEAERGAFAIPTGFNRGYTGPYSDLRLTLDSRRPGQERGSSAKVEIESEQGSDFEHTPVGGWIRWGGNAGAFVDLTHHHRILGLQVATTFADPLGHQAIPFTELASLGGDSWMRGYFAGRLVDRSAAAALVTYEWPIAAKLDASLEAAVGNVFGEHLEGFDPRLLRFSGAVALTARTNDPPLQLMVGFGTETFEHGAQVDSVRVTIGVPRSF